MPTTKRNKIVTTTYATDRVTWTYYTPPGDQPQQIAGTYTCSYDDLPPHSLLTAMGLTALISQRCAANRNGAHPNIPDIIKTILATAKGGGLLLQPAANKRTAAATEPTPLQLALAELRGVPVNQVVFSFTSAMRTNPDGTTYHDSKGRTHRLFTRPMITQLESHPKVAAIIARIMQERGSQASPEQGLDLTTLPL